MAKSGAANALYENTGDGNFKKVETGAIVTDSADSYSAAWGTHRTRWWFVCGGEYGGGAGGSGGGNGD